MAFDLFRKSLAMFCSELIRKTKGDPLLLFRSIFSNIVSSGIGPVSSKRMFGVLFSLIRFKTFSESANFPIPMYFTSLIKTKESIFKEW